MNYFCISPFSLTKSDTRHHFIGADMDTNGIYLVFFTAMTKLLF
jgi:hypothetical protein